MADLSGPLLPVLIFLIAALYSSVGHGGASGYLAVLAVLGVSAILLRPSALILNLCVSGIAFAGFASSGHFRWKLFWPFAVGSIPLAFIGAGITVDPEIYKRLLAVCLLFAVARLFNLFGRGSGGTRAVHVIAALLIGAGIGLLSGVIGIGGGIILSPILLLLRWSTAHEAAAVSALFILVNSAAGLLGLSFPSELYTPSMLILTCAAIAGGIVGSFYGARRSTDVRIRQLLGCVLLFASIKLMIA